MNPNTVPPIQARRDRPEPVISVDLQELLPVLISNIIGDAAYHPRLRAKAIAELSAGGVLRTEQRVQLSTDIAAEMAEFGHTKLEFTPTQVLSIIALLHEALDELEEV